MDVGGTNTDAVLMDRSEVIAWTKHPTTADVSTGVAGAIDAVRAQAAVDPAAIGSVMIGTTHFANALVERSKLDKVGILRLASPSGEALPPLTAWPSDLIRCIGENIFLLPGGYEVDGREISPLDEDKVRDAARRLARKRIEAVAISSAFAPVNSAMEERAAAIVRKEHPSATITLSHTIGRLGFIERENATILNAALGSLASKVISSFETALHRIGVRAPLYISQNDGTLISAAQAAAHPVLTIGSGPTNSMRGAAFLTDVTEGIVIDVGGTTTDIGVLTNGFPRESSIAVDIGGVRTNFRMPDILSIGLGGGTRVHLDPSAYSADLLDEASFAVGPDSVGFRIAKEAMLFGGSSLTASDIAVAGGHAEFGTPTRLPPFSAAVVGSVWGRFQNMLEDAVDRMKTMRGDTTVIAVGGANFLISDALKGSAKVVRPAHAAVANAVGAAIAQVGAQVEHVVAYDNVPRALALEQAQAEACSRAVAAGADRASVQVVDVEEVYLSYLPGRAAQLRVRAVGDLAADTAKPSQPLKAKTYAHH